MHTSSPEKTTPSQPAFSEVFVDEDQLPDGCEWAFIAFDGRLVLAIKRAHWSPELMAEAWASYVEVSAA